MANFCDQAIDEGILISQRDVIEDPDHRAEVAAEIDTFVAREVYGLTKQEMLYILDPANILGEDCGVETFKALRNREVREFGEYRTQKLILEAWDRLDRGEIDELAPAVVPMPRHTPEPRTLHDIAAAADGAWARPMTNPRGETMEVLLAALRVIDGPCPSEQVRLAVLLAIEPHRLLPYLDAERASDWRRVVGEEANGSARNSAEIDEHWGIAVRHFRSRGWLEEMAGNWGPGTLPESFQIGEWALGRAAIAWESMRGIGAKAEVISLFSAQLNRWRNAEAA